MGKNHQGETRLVLRGGRFRYLPGSIRLVIKTCHNKGEGPLCGRKGNELMGEPEAPKKGVKYYIELRPEAWDTEWVNYPLSTR